MIFCEQVPPRDYIEETAFLITYKTPKREGSQRFGGYRARDKATAFANEIVRELLDDSDN